MVKTFTLRLDTPSDRTLHIPLPPDVPEGPIEVVLVITSAQTSNTGVDLAGRWQSYFPQDFDIDQALKEIRREWEAE